MSSFLKKLLKNKKSDLNNYSPYVKLNDNECSKLLGDRIEFKLWSAQRHLDKLIEIENKYGGIMGENKIYAEDELDCYFAQIIGARDALLMLINQKLGLNLSEQNVLLKTIRDKLDSQQKRYIIKELDALDDDKTSWYSILNEFRNKSIHRSILNKMAKVGLHDNINNNTSSSNVKNYFLMPTDYKDSMDKEITEFLTDCIKEMLELIRTIKKNAGI